MALNGVKICDFSEGMICDGCYVLKDIQLKKTAAGKYYLDIMFLDETGEINAKKWDSSQEELERFQKNKIYFVNTRVNVWQKNLQLSINSIRLADEETQKNIDQFVPAAPYSGENMLDTIYSYIEKIENKDLKKLTTNIYKENEEKLLYYPAAKALHHALRGGYLYHVTTMLKTAEKLAEVYPEVRTDLLFTGVLLHDIMKIKELEANELGLAEYSTEGQLMGHIEMGICLVDEKEKELELDPKIMLLVKHMILSHHYQPEYGSTKKPMFLEAELLHYIDLIDARVYDFGEQYNSLMPGEFSDRIWSLERRIYRPDIL